MKRILTFLVVVLVVSLSGCTNNEDTNNSKGELINTEEYDLYTSYLYFDKEECKLTLEAKDSDGKITTPQIYYCTSIIDYESKLTYAFIRFDGARITISFDKENETWSLMNIE